MAVLSNLSGSRAHGRRSIGAERKDHALRIAAGAPCFAEAERLRLIDYVASAEGADFDEIWDLLEQLEVLLAQAGTPVEDGRAGPFATPGIWDDPLNLHEVDTAQSPSVHDTLALRREERHTSDKAMLASGPRLPDGPFKLR